MYVYMYIKQDQRTGCEERVSLCVALHMMT